MASTSRFDLLRDALMDMFPGLSQSDAEALTWGGMENTIAFSALTAVEGSHSTNELRL